MKTVKIIERSVSTDKNDKNYAKLSVETSGKALMIDEVTGQKLVVNLPAKRSTVLAWEESYLDGKSQFGWNLKQGDMVAGDIVTRRVVEYEILSRDGEGESRMVNTYTCFVAGNTDDVKSFDAEIIKSFTRASREIVDNDGQIVNPINPKASNTTLKVNETVDSEFAKA